MAQPVEGAVVKLKGHTVRQALDRLSMLGLVDDDAAFASETLTRLITEAIERGERNQENLILYAMGRFQSR